MHLSLHVPVHSKALTDYFKSISAEEGIAARDSVRALPTTSRV